MLNSVSLDKIRTSLVTKAAGLFVLAVLAVAFFVFPLGAFAAGGSQLPTAKLFGVYESCGAALNVEVDTKQLPQYMLAPFLNTSGKVGPSSFFDAIFNGRHVTGMYLNKETHQAVLIVNGKQQLVTLTNADNTNNINSSKK